MPPSVYHYRVSELAAQVAELEAQVAELRELLRRERAVRDQALARVDALEDSSRRAWSVASSTFQRRVDHPKGLI